jgi:adsorption protein B
VLRVFASWATVVDGFLAAMMLPAAIAILLSGIDDVILLLVCATRRLPAKQDVRSTAEKRLAIFVPCWQESAVIRKMVEHNVAAIRYQAYDFFIGAYPNDDATLGVVRDLEPRFANVHLAVCPHPGPTSKADCLNWIYQRMLVFEESHDVRFDAVLTHDAEDLIHPDSLVTTNHYLGMYDMVQIPVLALPTPLRQLTHGVYCDDFAEFQIKDMRARGLMNSFIPSNGVGTAYSRQALQRLAESESNRIFEPACLTEDYENGMRLHNLGCRQIFVPPLRGPNGFVATREYFPSNRAAAIRQRTRWVTGIALQTWERHGWSGSLSQRYWFWRDRKGLFGAPLSFATNVMFAVGCATGLTVSLAGQPWTLIRHHPLNVLLIATFVLQTIHLSVRMFCSSRIYGWTHALGVPLRVVWANYINASASTRALFRYALARWRQEPLVWVKTEHAYPSRNALFLHKRRLGEILVGCSYLHPDILESALLSKPPELRLGEHLVQLGVLEEDELYEALSLQQSLPSGRVEPLGISSKVARALPRRVIHACKVLPFRIQEGNLFLASPEIPTDELNHELRTFTRMGLQFHLVTPENFRELTRTLL